MELSINMPTNLFYAQHLTFHCEILSVDIFALLLSFGTSMDTFRVRIFLGFCFSKPFQVSILRLLVVNVNPSTFKFTDL